jgi:hypothetical protein
MAKNGWRVCALVCTLWLPGCGGDDGGSSDGSVPTEADALFAFLQGQSYRNWTAESTPHASSGPHGVVHTYVNDTLAKSLAAGSAAHPKGAAAVKELYATDVHTGWAVWVKLDADSAAGQSIYWYEVFSTTDGSSPAADGTGVPLCAGCHGGSTNDFFLSPYPLQ